MIVTSITQKDSDKAEKMGLDSLEQESIKSVLGFKIRDVMFYEEFPEHITIVFRGGFSKDIIPSNKQYEYLCNYFKNE